MNKALKKQRRMHYGGAGNLTGMGGDRIVTEDGRDKRRKHTKISKHKQGYKKR